MFGQVGPTPYDLYFPVGRIPVRVNPSFWLISVLMAYGLFDAGRFDLLAIWVVCLFVSILVHELGHAAVALAFGYQPQVFLYHFGGLAMYYPDRRHTMGRSVAISLAGPVAGFALYGLVLLTVWQLPRLDIVPGEHGRYAIRQLEWINLVWGLVNLLPVLPLDGGRICEAVCLRFSNAGREVAARVSVVVAGAVAVFFLWQRERYGLYPVFLFGLLCAQNVQTLQAPRDRGW
jgi:stage IV sporulation protein FB